MKYSLCKESLDQATDSVRGARQTPCCCRVCVFIHNLRSCCRPLRVPIMGVDAFCDWIRLHDNLRASHTKMLDRLTAYGPQSIGPYWKRTRCGGFEDVRSCARQCIRSVEWNLIPKFIADSSYILRRKAFVLLQLSVSMNHCTYLVGEHAIVMIV